MGKMPISVTLRGENITWLRGRAAAGGLRSVSELLDRLVTAARQRGDVPGTRSVVGTIDIDASDPELEVADQAVRATFERSLAQPVLLHESPPRYRAPVTKRRSRRG